MYSSLSRHQLLLSLTSFEKKKESFMEKRKKLNAIVKEAKSQHGKNTYSEFAGVFIERQMDWMTKSN